MKVIEISGVASHVFGAPTCCSTTRAFKIRSFKFYSDFNNVPHMGLAMSLKANCYKAHPMFWGREFQSRKEHLNDAAPYKWLCKRTSSLVVYSTSYYQRNDVEDIKSIEKKVKKDPKLPVSSEVAGFNLYIRRNLVTKNVNKHIPSPSLSISALAPVSNGSATSTSLSISKSKPSLDGIQRILDTATDEGLVILQSPKVGYFRRSRTIKGKRAPPSCNEKQEVKEGQVLCYIEQLGGEIPVESDVSGEVIKILKKDGEPVGYGDALIAILPSFPGIKKLQ